MSGTALVTGAASGIGKALALALLNEGWTVLGTSRNPSSAPADMAGIKFYPLDLTDEGSIDTLAGQLPALDLLVNCAGQSLMSAVEETPMTTLRALFELIVFGNIRLIQGVLPAMREAGHGLIVNIGSYAEMTPVPCSAAYAGAKSALRVISSGLRQEVRPFGVKVVTVAPTFVKTAIVQERLCPEASVYSEMIRKSGVVRDRSIDSGGSPEDAAKKIMKIIRKKNPAPFYPVGKNAFILDVMRRIFPEKLRERIIRGHFKI